MVGDGTEGLPQQAQFDAILVSAAFPSVVQSLIDQLADGGHIVQPIGRGGDKEFGSSPRRRPILCAAEPSPAPASCAHTGQHGFRA
jgi:protein-L-isoaspartate O-methyltransferase